MPPDLHVAVPNHFNEHLPGRSNDKAKQTCRRMWLTRTQHLSLWFPPVRMQRRQRVFPPFRAAISARFVAADHKFDTCFYYLHCPEFETSWIIVLTSAMSHSQHVPSPAMCVQNFGFLYRLMKVQNFLLRHICFLYYFEKEKPSGHPHIRTNFAFFK
jgi:hypothetical protein